MRGPMFNVTTKEPLARFSAAAQNFAFAAIVSRDHTRNQGEPAKANIYRRLFRPSEVPRERIGFRGSRLPTGIKHQQPVPARSRNLSPVEDAEELCLSKRVSK
jgi:hypothetical protein